MFFQKSPKMVQYQSVQQTSIAQEFVVQMPAEGNISLIQPAEIVNCAPIVHTVSPVQSNGYVQNIDSTTSLYIFAPSPLTIQIPSNESTMPSVEIPMETDFTSMVSELQTNISKMP